MRSFFVQEFWMKHFCTYILGLYIFGSRLLVQKLLLNCWWNWHLVAQFSARFYQNYKASKHCNKTTLIVKKKCFVSSKLSDVCLKHGKYFALFIIIGFSSHLSVVILNKVIDCSKIFVKYLKVCRDLKKDYTEHCNLCTVKKHSSEVFVELEGHRSDKS